MPKLLHVWLAIKKASVGSHAMTWHGRFAVTKTCLMDNKFGRAFIGMTGLL